MTKIKKYKTRKDQVIICLDGKKDDLEPIAEQYSSKFLFYNNRECVGYIGNLGKNLHMSAFNIFEPFRNKGLGTIAIQKVIEYLRRKKKLIGKMIKLDVRANNAAAIRIYTKVGFKKTGILIDPGENFDRYDRYDVMSLKI
jgi:ribosomal protein S18 acetylase RimI-like enzyme